MGKILPDDQPKNRVRKDQQNMEKQQLKHYAINKIKNRKASPSNQISFATISRAKTFQANCSKFILSLEKNMLNEIVDQKTFECPICLEIMIKPTLLECGHAYCAKCLEELMIYKSTCGVCRHIQNDPEFKNSSTLESMIENFIIKKSINSFDYYVRLTDTQNWKKARGIEANTLCKGEFIDFRDKELRWRKGEISRIAFEEETNQYVMQVSYIKSEQQHIEKLSFNSNRIAKFSYYTKMKYLETVKAQNNIVDESQVAQIFPQFTQNFINMNDEIDVFFFSDALPSQEQDENENYQFEDLISMPTIHRLVHHQSLTDIFQNNGQQEEPFFQFLN